ncbi:MAG: FG-GAP-like repeat-containing protein [Lacibacter sp.]
MNIKIGFFFIMFLIEVNCKAQHLSDSVKSIAYPVLPKISNSNIPGAPILTQPVLITGTVQEIRTEKHGLVYPLFYDWNKDGKNDLLLGEFESGQTGSNIKVYLNEGTIKRPVFSGKYFYATDVNGDTMTTYEWCCIGTNPRLADLNNDGIIDILSGQYSPGEINWWPGGLKGFEPRRFVDQEAMIKDNRMLDVSNLNQADPTSSMYWIYTSAGFADVNGDGLVDMLVGGITKAELRYALNIGTAANPKFGRRRNLLGIDGLPLSVVNRPGIKQWEEAKKANLPPFFAGIQKSFITPIDWDGDGVLDLLVTHMYGDSFTKDPVIFFRGVNTDKGLRFESAVSLFTAKDAAKTFPGCQPNITITDFNGDGVYDLVIGISLPTVNGFQIDSTVAWSYLHELGIESPGKDIGKVVEWMGGIEKANEKMAEQPQMKRFILGKLTEEKYLTLRHRGYVYVMLGKKNPVKAVQRKKVKAEEEVQLINTNTQSSRNEGPVTYSVKTPSEIFVNENDSIEVIINFKKGWYGYVSNEINIAEGWIPTGVDFEFPVGLKKIGETVLPSAILKGATEIYKGNHMRFVQHFMCIGKNDSDKLINMGDQNINITIHYQICNEEQCLPPVEEKIMATVTLKSK